MFIHVQFPKAIATAIKKAQNLVLQTPNKLHSAHSVQHTSSHAVSKWNLISTPDTFNWSYPLLVSVQQHPTYPVCGPFLNHLQENFRLYSDALTHAGVSSI